MSLWKLAETHLKVVNPQAVTSNSITLSVEMVKLVSNFGISPLGHVSDSGPGTLARMNGAREGGPIKSNSESRAVQLSRCMMEQLAVSEKAGKEGGAWC